MRTHDLITRKLTEAFRPESLRVLDESHRHEGHAGVVGRQKPHADRAPATGARARPAQQRAGGPQPGPATGTAE